MLAEYHDLSLTSKLERLVYLSRIPGNWIGFTNFMKIKVEDRAFLPGTFQHLKGVRYSNNTGVSLGILLISLDKVCPANHP